MDLRLFPLVAYLAATVYLVSWLLRQLWAFYQQIRAWKLQQRMVGKVLSMETWNKVGEGWDVLIYLAGALFGGLVAFWMIQLFIQEWLLVIFVVLAVLSEEMQVSMKETQLLDVIVFFERMLAQNDQCLDLFEGLTKAIQDLPEGNVQKSIREAVLRRLSGEDIEKSLRAMRGTDPFLDEFVLTLRMAGWQNGSALSLILNRLLGRVGRRWDCTSKILRIKDKSHPYVRFGQGALIAGLWVIIISNSSALANVMPGRAVIFWSGLALLCFGLMFNFIVSTKWLRRFLAVSIFILAFVSYANSLVILMPSWIQVETISHRSDSVTDTEMAITQMTTTREEEIALFRTLGIFRIPIVIPTSIPTPTVLPTITATPIMLLSTPVIPEVMYPCCHRSHQPR